MKHINWIGDDEATRLNFIWAPLQTYNWNTKLQQEVGLHKDL